jgi:hypothetical protein
VGKSQRTKGAAAEREVAALLTDALGVSVKRKLGQARDSGDDIQVGRYRLEIKRCETLRMQEWCEQVEAACGPQDVPVVVYRRSGQPWRAVLLLDDLVPLLRGEV